MSGSPSHRGSVRRVSRYQFTHVWYRTAAAGRAWWQLANWCMRGANWLSETSLTATAWGVGLWTSIRMCSITRTDAIALSTRMWANAQRDGRPAKYRWRPLFNAAKFGWRPLLECRAVTLPRRETRWNLQGCPKLANRSYPLVGRSSPYCGDMWRRYCCLTSFFPIVDTWLRCKDIARQSCAIVPKWRFFASCISREPHAVHFRPAF